MRHFDLGVPPKALQERMAEVHFYVIIGMFKETQNNTYMDAILENLCHIFETKVSIINNAIHHMFSPLGRPTPMELGLLNKTVKIPFRKLTKYARKNNRTLYNALEVYFTDPEEYPISPKLPQNFRNEIIIFNQKFCELFPLAGMENAEEFYQELRPIYDGDDVYD